LDFLPFCIALATPSYPGKMPKQMLNICQETFLPSSALPHKQQDVTLVQFVPSNWVVEGIGEIVKSEHCNLLTQSRATTHCKRHHLQSRATIGKQGQLLQLKCSHQQSRATFDRHNQSRPAIIS
jgi:hypothetical protein